MLTSVHTQGGGHSWDGERDAERQRNTEVFLLTADSSLAVGSPAPGIMLCPISVLLLNRSK